MNPRICRMATARLLALAVVASVSAAHAQTDKLQGIIKARNGAILIVQVDASTEANVLLTDYTKVDQSQGVLKLRKKGMSMAALIPGLPIQAEGMYYSEKQLVAKSVKFKGDDLQQARSIQAGMHETRDRSVKNTQELEKQNAAIQAQQRELTAAEQKIEANKAAIEASIARFGQLDDYYILDEATVYFANGKVNVEAKYKPDLLRVAEKARTVQGFMIEVKGYASSVGNEAVNQKLSQERAQNVASFLLQQGRIPLTNLLAPGAMGESNPAASDATVEGQAENRRVVVRVLQNKAIAGI